MVPSCRPLALWNCILNLFLATVLVFICIYLFVLVIRLSDWFCGFYRPTMSSTPVLRLVRSFWGSPWLKVSSTAVRWGCGTNCGWYEGESSDLKSWKLRKAAKLKLGHIESTRMRPRQYTSILAIHWQHKSIQILEMLATDTLTPTPALQKSQ